MTAVVTALQYGVDGGVDDGLPQAPECKRTGDRLGLDTGQSDRSPPTGVLSQLTQDHD